LILCEALLLLASDEEDDRPPPGRRHDPPRNCLKPLVSPHLCQFWTRVEPPQNKSLRVEAFPSYYYSRIRELTSTRCDGVTLTSPRLKLVNIRTMPHPVRAVPGAAPTERPGVRSLKDGEEGGDVFDAKTLRQEIFRPSLSAIQTLITD
jgi:hypothetical protein